jgi:glycosyltransferase involved in cell wall biosynthesis
LAYKYDLLILKREDLKPPLRCLDILKVKMIILFITRNFPPQVGGLEKVAFHLYSYLKKEGEVILLKWSGSKKILFLVLPYILLRAFLILSIKRVDIIYLNEGFLSILGIILKLFKIPIIITIHGLDITYKNKFYQFIIPKCISSLDRIICISRATKKECIKRRISERKICIIPDGLEDEFYIDTDKEKLKEKFMEETGIKVGNKKILLSVCRLIERKGIHWFVDRVIPLLIDDYRDFVYIVAGDGPMCRHIKHIIHKKKLHNWVILLGRIHNGLLKLLYNISDIFIMPNIPVAGDIEGFGVVVLEAASCKLPIVASNLEGIRDVLLDGEVGILVPSSNPCAFREKILALLSKDYLCREVGERERDLAIKYFMWHKIAKRYLNVFEEVR